MLLIKTLKQYLLAVISLWFVLGCSSGSDPGSAAQFIPIEPTHELLKVGEFYLPLDSVTPGNLSHYQYYTNDTTEYFTLLNPINQEINFYELKSRTLSFKIPLHYEGPHSIGNLSGFNSGYRIHNLDSIFVLNRSRAAFFLINKKSERLLTYDFMRSKEQSSAILPNQAPMVVNGNMTILSNIPAEIKFNRRNRKYKSEYATRYNLEDMSMTFDLSYPEVYESGAWPMSLYKICWADDPDSKRLVVSYPLDDFIYVYDYDFNLLEVVNGKSSLKERNRSITKQQASDRFENRKYYWSQSKYNKIYYDPYRRVYLRECMEPVSPKGLLEMDEGIMPTFNRALVIMDEQLNVIGEFIEPFREELNMFFAEDGIYRWVESANEDELKFYKYELSSI